jgi:D-3-phosphoglycerate dehydrogenase
MLVVRNEDRPGMIGLVGSTLREINIEDMDVGRSPEGEAAMMVLSTSDPVPRELVETLRAAPGITSVHPLELP